MRRLASLVIVLAASSAADAKPRGHAALEAHMRRAAKAHKAGNYQLALEELKAAYAIDPQPKLLYAIAQVHAKLDDCAKAIDYYEQFIAATPEKDKQTIAQQAIDACKQRLPAEAEPAAVEPAPEPPPEPVPAPHDEPHEAPPPEPPPREIRAFDEPRPASPPVATVTATTRSPWYRDPLGDALVIGGVGATIASVFTYRGVGRELDAAEGATTLADYADHRRSAERHQLYTFVLAGGGIALITAGVIRYALRDHRRETPAVAIVPASDGGLITWSGGF